MKKPLLVVLAAAVVLALVMPATQLSAGTAEGKIAITTASQEALNHYLQGRDLAEKLRGPQARAEFEKAIALDPDFALAHLLMAGVQPTAKGFFAHIDKAVALVDKVSDGERMMINGAKAGADAQVMKQREIYTKLVTAYPNDERAHNLLGIHYFGQQDWEKSIEEYKMATTINPDYSPPYNQMGYAYRFIGDYDEAETAFKRYIELIPDDPNPYDSYAELLMKMGRYEESITHYQKALDIDPTFVASHIGIATNRNFLGEHQMAREQLETMYSGALDDGQRRQAIFATSVSYVDEGNMEQALVELDKMYAIAERTNDPAAMAGDLVAMGNILRESGKPDQALEKYRMALTKIENSDLSEDVKATARRNYAYNEARVALARGDIATAKTKADEHLAKVTVLNNPNEVRLAHELRGMIAIENKDFKGAHANLLKANQQNPNNLYLMAVALNGQGDKQKAKQMCKTASEFNALNSMNQAFAKHKAKKLMAGL